MKMKRNNYYILKYLNIYLNTELAYTCIIIYNNNQFFKYICVQHYFIIVYNIIIYIVLQMHFESLNQISSMI